MAKGYWIARVDVNDEEAYKPYTVANPGIFKKYGGRFVVRGGQYECPEGSSRARNVVVEFPDYSRGGRVLSLARVPAEHENPAGHRAGRPDHRRGLRRPAVVGPLTRTPRIGISAQVRGRASCPTCGLWWPVPAGAWGAR